jgi:hypothetical protein
MFLLIFLLLILLGPLYKFLGVSPLSPLTVATPHDWILVTRLSPQKKNRIVFAKIAANKTIYHSDDKARRLLHSNQHVQHNETKH